MTETVVLTDYQFRCLRLAARPDRYLMLAHERGFRRLLALGFIYPDYVGCGAVWIAPSPEGRAHMHRRIALTYKETQ